MKSNIKTNLLLVAVFAVWGIIGFKMVSALDSDTSKIELQDTKVLFTPKEDIGIESFTIEPLERDPFLGTMRMKKEKHMTSKESKPKQQVVWMPIIYHGTVSKQGSKDKICVLSINGHQQILKVGQEVNAVKLIKATNSEIIVRYKGKRKTIVKT
ncbi:hypothetical protein [Thalassobellus citreus]|uniref:hypothetical protein n=1 Tax=Thalassobellus citreus TaxID=3367752 RepID=UPI0037B4C644